MLRLLPIAIVISGCATFDTDKARALATHFLAKHPDSPLAERVEHIISSGR